MSKIVDKSYFSPNVVRLEIEAPLIAKSRRAGHFVIVKVGEKGERIPLTIADSNLEKGTITLVVAEILGNLVGGPDGYTIFSGICFPPTTPNIES